MLAVQRPGKGFLKQSATAELTYLLGPLPKEYRLFGSVFPYKGSKLFSEDYKTVSFRLLNERTIKISGVMAMQPNK